MKLSEIQEMRKRAWKMGFLTGLFIGSTITGTVLGWFILGG